MRQAPVGMVPPAALEIMEKMSEGGFQCYLVGGCVRDLLLSRTPTDYDFVTDRLPGAIKQVAVDTGWKTWEHDASFGVVNVVMQEASYEIATMRAETYGDDPHRPENVTFLQDIKLDLSRRDFTINAMAMDHTGNLIDPFGGRDDLDKRVIRSVGNPRERLLEDPLRLLRAPRFAAQTGFQVDPAILEAGRVPGVQSRFRKLSVERVRDELEKILLAPHPARGLNILLEIGALDYTCAVKTGGEKEEVALLPEISRLKGVGQNPRFHRHDVLEHTLQTVHEIKPEITLRWTALLHDIAKGAEGVRTRNKKGEIADYGHAREGAEMARYILERLRVPRAVTTRVIWLINHHMDLNFANHQSAVRWIKKRAREFTNRDHFMQAIQQLFMLAQADNLARGKDEASSFLPEMEQRVQNIVREMVFYPRELNISGDFIIEKLGYQGPQVGKVLQDLLVDVQSGRLENTAEALQRAVLKKARRQKQSLP